MAQHVSDKVQEVLHSYWNEALPVNVEHIAHLMGINIFYELAPDNNPNLSGVFYYYNNVPTFIIRSSDRYTRRRFTLAHELGHYLLGHTGEHGRLFRDNERNFSGFQNDIQEMEANQFAAEFLMPAASIENLIKYTNQTIESLAQIFAVSESAMTYRLKNLGYL